MFRCKAAADLVPHPLCWFSSLSCFVPSFQTPGEYSRVSGVVLPIKQLHANFSPGCVLHKPGPHGWHLSLGNGPLRMGICSWIAHLTETIMLSFPTGRKRDGKNPLKLSPMFNCIGMLVEPRAWRDQVFDALDQCGSNNNYVRLWLGWLLLTALEAKLKHTLKARRLK